MSEVYLPAAAAVAPALAFALWRLVGPAAMRQIAQPRAERCCACACQPLLAVVLALMTLSFVLLGLFWAASSVPREVLFRILIGLGVALATLSSASVLARFSARMTSRRSSRMADTYRHVLDFDPGRRVRVIIPRTGPVLTESAPGRLAWEDSAATSGISQTLGLAGWTEERVSFSDDAHFDRMPRGDNLIVVASPQRNRAARAVLESLTLERRFAFRFAQQEDNPRRWEIVADSIRFRSPSYEQEAHLRSEAGARMVDYALLARVANPWNPGTKVLLVAGIRGFGTWGAAQHLHRSADELQRLTKGRDFGVVLEVVYDDYRIQRTGTVHVELL